MDKINNSKNIDGRSTDIFISEIQTEFVINSLKENAQRYEYTIDRYKYNALVTDLDGVVLENGSINQVVFNTLINRTLLNPNERIPLAFATGRSFTTTQKVILNFLLALLSERGILLKEGDLTVYSDNGSFSVDIATNNVIESLPISPNALQEAIRGLDALSVLLNLREIQLTQLDTNGVPVLKKRSVSINDFTFSFGINPEYLVCLDDRLVEVYHQIYGRNYSLLTIVQVLNKLFIRNGMPLNATTTGRSIEINAIGVNKGRAVSYISRRIGCIEDNVISIGDSVLGNDQEITQRVGGFANVPIIIPGRHYPLFINEAGNQFQRVGTFLNRVRLENT